MHSCLMGIFLHFFLVVHCSLSFHETHNLLKSLTNAFLLLEVHSNLSLHGAFYKFSQYKFVFKTHTKVCGSCFFLLEQNLETSWKLGYDLRNKFGSQKVLGVLTWVGG